MALIDETYLRDAFQIHKDVPSPRLAPYVAAASRRLKAWVGSTVYQTIDADTKAILKLAEATLAMHFLIRNLNTSIRGKGLVASESVEGNVTIRYLNPAETEQLASGYLADAEELVREWIEPTITNGVEFAQWQAEATSRLI